MSFMPLICDEIQDILFPGENLEESFRGRRYRRSKEFLGDRFCKNYKHPWALKNRRQLNTSEVKTGKDTFQVNLNVQQFSPEELTVKTVKNFIVVEGKQEEKQDEYGYISRHFIRKYKLPDEYDSTTVQSSLSSDGVLIVTSTKLVSESNEKEIPIKLIGPVKRNDATNNKNKEKNSEDENELIME